MISFTHREFSITSARDSKCVRDKLDQLGKFLVQKANSVSTRGKLWSHYVTGKSGYSDQWAAIYPFPPVKDNKDLITYFPCIVFNIPQDGGNPIIAVNAEFQRPRELVVERCSKSSVASFLKVLHSTLGAKVGVYKKEVDKSDHRRYTWGDLWDKARLPEIDVQLCTPQYLNNFYTTGLQSILHPDGIHIWETIFLVKYDFLTYDYTSNNVETLLSSKVERLVPVLEHIVWQ